MSELTELAIVRHSLAHIMAAAINQLWPEAKFGVGPVIENGFYYDIEIKNYKLSEIDFQKIEKEMKKIIAADDKFVKSEEPIDQAIAWAKEVGQPYKEELLNDLKRSGTTIAKEIELSELGIATEDATKIEKVTFYSTGSFKDLCRGPHIQSSKDAGAFKLTKVAGAYWRGIETNPQLQRVYAVAFNTELELQDYLKMQEEAKSRDHRKLGQELDLFIFSDLVGPGLPLWTPRGTFIRNQLDSFVQGMRDEVGFMPVAIPHITKKELYQKSGHWDKFSDELFKIITREGHEFAMKPMNCPHHAQIYSSKQRSYRELPIRYRETTTCYRDEQTGELNGLSRVRAFSQDDAHVFSRYSQVKQEVLNLWDIVEKFYSAFDMAISLRLSVHDPENKQAYLGTEQQWIQVEQELTDIAVERVGDKFEKGIGEAAFYGPKLDFIAKDAIGRTWQVATIQFDFNQPEGFDLSCINEDGESERIVMIHCAIMGSLERFMSILIEHLAGRLPVWLAPEQIRLLTVNQDEKLSNFANSVVDKAKSLGLRVTLDNGNDSLGKKIRDTELLKIPYTVVIGEKEVNSNTLNPRIRKDMEVQKDHQEISFDHFLNTISNEAKSRVLKTTI